MKRKYLHVTILATALAVTSFSSLCAQEEGFGKSAKAIDQKEVTKLRKAVEARPGDLERHKAYLQTFGSGDEAREQYEKWMKKFPTVAAIPQALGEKYGGYSPKAGQYFLMAAKLEPANAALWEKLALDAAFRGERSKQMEYTEKAITADPTKLNLQVNYIFLLKENEALYKQRAYEFANQYPSRGETGTVLHLLGTDIKDKFEKIAVWEDLRKRFPEAKELTVQVAMSRLNDVYFQTGQYEKARELAAFMQTRAEERLGFSPKLKLAQALIEAEGEIKKGRFEEARRIVEPLEVRSRFLFDIGNSVVLMKAFLMDTTGATGPAYDSLLLFQAETPDKDVLGTLYIYGSKLGKTSQEVKADINRQIERNSKPAPHFSLDSYTEKRKINLEDLKGKVVLLSFWYPACGPCRGEMPHFETVIKKFKKDEIVYLGVNGYRAQDDFVLPFMRGTKYSFNPLAGEKPMIKDYQVSHYPTNFLIDKEGKIAYSDFQIGSDSEEMLELMIRALTEK